MFLVEKADVSVEKLVSDVDKIVKVWKEKLLWHIRDKGELMGWILGNTCDIEVVIDDRQYGGIDLCSFDMEQGNVQMGVDIKDLGDALSFCIKWTKIGEEKSNNHDKHNDKVKFAKYPYHERLRNYSFLGLFIFELMNEKRVFLSDLIFVIVILVKIIIS